MFVVDRTQLEDRRAFLRKLGLSVPAAVIAAGVTTIPVEASESKPPEMLTAEDVYTIYVTEMATALPAHMREAMLIPGGVMRSLIEAQAYAMTVLLVGHAQFERNIKERP